MEKLVSIITPLYNSEKTISKTISSVRDQKYSNWELIIVDDQSTDNSVGIVSEFAIMDPRIHLVQLSEKSITGVAGVRNVGISAAKGEYIAFLDSDDIFLPSKLSDQISFMETNDFSFTYANYFVFNEKKGRILKEYISPSKVTYRKLLKHCSIGCLTAVYNAKKLGKKYMPEKATKREDFALWLDILKDIPAINVGKTLGIYRVHSNSVSSKKIKMAKYQFNVIYKVEKKSFFASIFFLACWAWLGFFKYRGSRPNISSEEMKKLEQSIR